MTGVSTDGASGGLLPSEPTQPTIKGGAAIFLMR